MPPCRTDAHCCDARPPSSLLFGVPPLSRGGLPHEHAQEQSTEGNVDELLRLAALELEAMRARPAVAAHVPRADAPRHGLAGEPERSFPPACLRLLHALLPGNARCHDCQAPAADWASVSYGIVLCLECSGRHRGLGVGVSFVKSLSLDGWKAREILCMLEGGNAQLDRFFDRHGMGRETASASAGGEIRGIHRYRTKAASFYRQHLASHARQLAEREGLYKGREASRRKAKSHKAAASLSPSNREPKRIKPTERPPPQLLPSRPEKEPP